MSVRQALLCDHGGCNDPATGTCGTCKRDGCKAHLGAYYLTVAVMEGSTVQTGMTLCLGKCTGVSICTDCHRSLDPYTKALSSSEANKMVMSALVQSMRDQLIETAAAFLAEKKLEKKVET